MTGDNEKLISITPSKGILVMLDALGVRGMSIEKCKEFLQNWINLISSTDESLKLTVDAIYQRTLANIQQQDDNAVNPSVIETDIRPEFMTFGDTIVILWHAKYSVTHYVNPLAFVLCQLILSALEAGIPMRGAISVGDFISSNAKDSHGNSHRSVIGPAVSETAIWHEKANLIGVIASPTFALKIRQVELLYSKANERMPPLWVYTAIPCKNGETHELWSIGWPNMHCNAEADINSQKYGMLEYFSRCTNIFYDNAKYENTLKFYEECIRKERELVREKKGADDLLK